MQEDLFRRDNHAHRDRLIIIIAVCLSLLLVGTCFTVPYLLSSSSKKPAQESTAADSGASKKELGELEKMLWASDAYREAQNIVRVNYVEEVGQDELLEAAAKGTRRMAAEGAGQDALLARGIQAMVDSLDDPFSSFMTRQELEMLDTQLTGHFSGIGVAMQRVKNEIRVVNVLENTPAQEMGIREGDIIEEVDGKDVSALELDEVVMLIRGPQGTVVRLGIRRPPSPETVYFDIVRREIEIPVMREEIKEGGVGYLRISDWTEDAYDKVRRALSDLASRGARSLVIDLRSNPGGYMEPAIEAADLFLRGGVIVSSRGRTAGVNKEYKADDDAFWDLPVVVLVNRGSASASEIFAAALRDNERCRLVGETTFGKGSIQKIFRQGDGTGIRLTIARYYTPKGINIDEQGIVPDFTVKNPVVGTEDLQLEKALELARSTL